MPGLLRQCSLAFLPRSNFFPGELGVSGNSRGMPLPIVPNRELETEISEIWPRRPIAVCHRILRPGGRSSDGWKFRGSEFDDLFCQFYGLHCVLFSESQGGNSTRQSVGISGGNIEPVQKCPVFMEREEFPVVCGRPCNQLRHGMAQDQSLASVVKDKI